MLLLTKFLFSFIPVIFLTKPLISQELYLRFGKEKTLFRLENTRDVFWEFLFPFDMQYRLDRFQEFTTFEGKNTGSQKIWIKTSIIGNRKNISLSYWEDIFFRCKKSIDTGITIPVPHEICEEEGFSIFRGYVYFRNTFFIIYAVWKNNLPGDDLTRIYEFLKNLAFRTSKKEF